jgi:tRNA modification GTPase
MDRRSPGFAGTIEQPADAVRPDLRKDTIFALSSGAPPSGIAIVRASGPAVRFGLATMAGPLPEPREASLRAIRGAAGDVLDRGLVLFFPGPNSVTGEDVLELHLHGGRAVIAAVLAELGRMRGFRPAEAGEFTRRAFEHGRMDLTEVEGLADLIAAETEAQRRQAVRQASGALGALYEEWRRQLIKARALIEAELDFADEDDIPERVSDQAFAEAAVVAAAIRTHLADRRGERLRDGIEVVILGLPNAGKSSLLNAIARRDVAIVGPEPGTTRDLIEVRLDLDGYPVTLVDTAGLRASASAVEREGVRRASARAAAADLVLWLEDVTAPSAPSPLDAAGASRDAIGVGTKLDLIDSVAERSRLTGRYQLLTSATTGEGIEALFSFLAEHARTAFAPGEAPLMTRERHRVALGEALAAIEAAVAATDAPVELRAEDLRRAGDALGRITGRIDVEDLLDVVFRDFCIGK